MFSPPPDWPLSQFPTRDYYLVYTEEQRKELTQLKEQLETQTKEIAELKSSSGGSGSGDKELKGKLTKCEEELAAKTKQLDKMKANFREINQKYTEAQKQIIDLQTQLNNR